MPAKSGAPNVRTDTAEARLLHFKKGDDVKLEFFVDHRVVIFFPDGIFGDVEWSDEAGSRNAASSPRGAITFNPSREYLRLRVRNVKCEFQALLLLIGPGLLNCVQEGREHSSALDLRRKVDLVVEEVAQTLGRICDELKHPGYYTAAYLHALIMLALAGLMRGLLNQDTGRRSTCAKGGLPNWRLKRALELLEGGLSEAPTLADVARPLKLHPTSFCRAFKQSTGLTPHRYLLLCRVNRAKEMMRNSDLKLTEIALDCGFNSSSQFSVVFKRLEGTSPRTFRRSMGDPGELKLLFGRTGVQQRVSK